MNAYITYCKDGYGGREVDQVFLNKDKAIDTVIATRLAGNSFYKDHTPYQLRIEAERYIETVAISE